VELLIALVLFGILLAIAVPRFYHLTGRSKVDQALTVVAGDLQQALSLAARRGRPLTLAQEDPSQYSVRDRAAPPDDSLRLRRNLHLAPDLGVATTTLSPASVTVFPNGTVSQALTVTLTNDGYTRQVTLSQTGMVRVVEP
jgi:type II secretory pathway pseudopilin PulG